MRQLFLISILFTVALSNSQVVPPPVRPNISGLSWDVKDSDYNRNDNIIAYALSLRANANVATGESYLSKAQKLKGGWGLELDGIFFDYVIAGVSLDYNYFETTDTRITGDISRTLVSFARYKLGARIPFKVRWAVDVVYYFEGDTKVEHSIKRGSRELSDEAEALMFGSRLNYWMNSTFSAFFNADYNRLTFSTAVPQEIAEFYNKETLIVLSLGITATF